MPQENIILAAIFQRKSLDETMKRRSENTLFEGEIMSHLINNLYLCIKSIS